MGDVNISIDTSGISSSISSASGMLSLIGSSTASMSSSIDNLAESIKEMVDAVIHMHDAHFHFLGHASEQRWDVGQGGFILPPPTGFGDKLAGEFNNSVDLDLNGLIYGRDFIIDVDDPNCPPSVRNIFETVPRKKRMTLKKISWKSYLATLPTPTPY